MNKKHLFSIFRLGFAVLSIFVFALTFSCSNGSGGSNTTTTTTPDTETPATSILPGVKGNIVAYHPEYRSVPTDAQLERLTHLVLFSITPIDHKISLPSGGGWVSNINNVVNRAHERGVKVIIALGGWDRTGSFPDSVKPANRQTFVNNIINFVNQYNLDGVDIDWEYPPDNDTDFQDFMIALKNALGSKRLSFAIGASGHQYTDATYNALDALHLMTYDGLTSSRPHHADMTWSKGVVNDWSQKLTPEKIFYGVPFYGRTGTSWQNWEEDTYAKIISSNQAVLSQTNNKPNHTANGVTGTYWYDGIPQVKEKTNYAWDKGIGGIMIWETGQDVAATSEFSLLNAIYQESMRLRGQ